MSESGVVVHFINKQNYHTGKIVLQRQNTHICILPLVALGHILDRTLGIEFTNKLNVVQNTLIFFPQCSISPYLTIGKKVNF